MRNSKYQMILKKLTENASNQYSISIPCLIFKKNDSNPVDFRNYIIDKDVLSQIIYELLQSVEFDDSCIPIIISFEDNTIDRMESEGVYILDGINNQFIYLFGAKDQRNFFNRIDKIRSELKINTSLIIGYLSNSVNQNHINQKYANKLNHLLDLHGNIYGKYTSLDYTEEITFPLLNKDFKLSLLHWIIRKTECKNDK